MTKKTKEGIKRVHTSKGYYSVLYEAGKYVGRTKWHGSNAESYKIIKERQHTRRQTVQETAPPPEPKPRISIVETEGNTIRYNEIVYYVTEHIRTTVKVGKGKKTRHSNVYCEVRLLDVVLPADMTPDMLMEFIRPYLQELAQSTITNINVGSSGGYPSNSLPTKTVTALMIKKNSGSNYEWYKETERVNIL